MNGVDIIARYEDAVVAAVEAAARFHVNCHGETWVGKLEAP